MDSPSPKRPRAEFESKSDDKDWISCLPEEVIGRILSRLTFREAQATCVLSRRWRHLCTSLVTDLDFDWLDLLEKMEDNPELAEKERARYVEWVDNVVHRQSGGDHALRRFALRFDLNISYKSRIDRWIRFALAKQVKVLELDFEPACSEDYKPDCDLSHLPYVLGYDILRDADVGCSQRASGRSNFGLSPSSSWHVGCRYLEELSLNRVSVEGELIEQLLANCPVLERLVLENAPTLNRLRVSGQSLKLKHLRIRYCRDFQRVEIYDTNLVSFAYRVIGEEIPLSLDKVPRLSEVSVERCRFERVHVTMSQLSSLSCLQILKLEFSLLLCETVWTRQLPKLTSVKQLELRVD
ncbi:F-box/LRR-repeat protein At2g42730-like [Syzygium oleosum]|uniref:F-box/LRR-repeat protein At2g42730-like n=1 Tax=Syzygium oleosum TaxID=219896 RepID=UPI0024BB20BE|nr:F-box/LRR-repeat protein At2g42730-like [Syzygium oleosum]